MRERERERERGSVSLVIREKNLIQFDLISNFILSMIFILK